jgi:lipid-binding SYLF domain-containing protein
MCKGIHWRHLCLLITSERTNSQRILCQIKTIVVFKYLNVGYRIAYKRGHGTCLDKYSKMELPISYHLTDPILFRT